MAARAQKIAEIAEKLDQLTGISSEKRVDKKLGRHSQDLPCLGLRDVSPSLAEHYLRALRRLSAGRRPSGPGSDEGWIPHSVGGANEAFLHLATGLVTWHQPNRGQLADAALDQRSLQRLVTETNGGRDRHEPEVVRIQVGGGG
ncbi:ras GTPase-activating-like protein IQGAP3 [Pollicipes pollicipes]|uniref:ras GTPase-activating-like protein IQGAP3 n=1 Tax=Pollicipes pollicipes TaxID=41117 RepID=UPI0018852369|nr:ras GTPase-activating-like protein IQGAP3 [Pollicipes pollicipes]